MVSRSTKAAIEKKGVAEGELKEEQLHDYELVLVISPEVMDDKLEATLSNFSRLVISLGGAVSEVTRWGKRKLAYPVKHFSEGNYFLVHFKLKSTLSRELEAKLHISEEVIRHLLTKLS